jgi:enamine deaminase RidA (YjgF/YER057c/UK114 family)
MPPLLVPSPSRHTPLIAFGAAVRVGDGVLVPGTTAVDAQGEVVGGDDAAAQAREALRKIEVALQAAGATLADVVLTRIHLTDLSRWEEVGRVHGEVFGDVRPIATMLGSAGLLDPRMLVEIEAEAYVGA